MPLNDLLKSLENHGEVNVKVAEHELSKSETGNFSVEALGGVSYVLDAKTQKKSNKKAKVLLTDSNVRWFLLNFLIPP